MITLSLKLILAHLLGDFLFQPTSWVTDKEKKKYKSKYLYYHILIHGILLLVLLSFDLKYLNEIILILVSHFLIDLLKLYFKGTLNQKTLFFGDQLIHLLVIALIVYVHYPYKINWEWLLAPHQLIIFISILLVTVVSSVVIRIVMQKWKLEEDSDGNSLQSAGSYIGVLERIFVFTFVLLNYWQAIGFLIAAKSIFRFGDLSKSKDRKLTEYILIGTFTSFTFAILIGLLYHYLKRFII